MPDDDENKNFGVHRVQINNLFEQLARMRDDMRDGFASLERKLDDRLESRDARLDDLEVRMREAEGKLRGQAVINAVLAALGGGALALVVRVITI